jgi:hypothetical protein
MKKALLTLVAGVGLLISGPAQQFIPITSQITTIPPVTWTGTNAQAIAAQLLAITNANGTRVIPPGLLTNRGRTILIRVDADTNGLRSLRATIR